MRCRQRYNWNCHIFPPVVCATSDTATNTGLCRRVGYTILDNENVKTCRGDLAFLSFLPFSLSNPNARLVLTAALVLLAPKSTPHSLKHIPLFLLHKSVLCFCFETSKHRSNISLLVKKQEASGVTEAKPVFVFTFCLNLPDNLPNTQHLVRPSLLTRPLQRALPALPALASPGPGNCPKELTHLCVPCKPTRRHVTPASPNIGIAAVVIS